MESPARSSHDAGWCRSSLGGTLRRVSYAFYPNPSQCSARPTYLRDLHRLIAADLSAWPIAHALLIHLSDLIDRGLASADVPVLRAAGPPIADLNILALRGNHEKMLLTALETRDGGDIDLWLRNGAADTPEGYDLSLPTACVWRERLSVRLCLHLTRCDVRK